MTQLEMNEYLKVLESKRAELVYRHRGRASIAVEPAADDMDKTQGAQERDLAVGAFDRDSRLLHEVRCAIDRIEEGTFGICPDCELDIKPKRLAALPWATRCVECQEASDAAESEDEPLSNVA